MVRYQVILVYDGTQFCGFQRQKNARTVQGEFEVSLHSLGWQGRSILAAGRTDSGVHASGQVVAFDLDWKHTPGDLRAALNSSLPPDLAVQVVKPAKANFHPRYDALARCYRYHIFCRDVRHPLQERYAWRVWPAVQLASLQQTASQLTGTHDFAAFGTPPRAGGNTIRSVTEAGWRANGAELVFEITANAFLYRMVRRLVYTQVAIGQGKLEADTIRRSLESGSKTMVQGLAPPQGLFLVEVVYPPEVLAEA